MVVLSAALTSKSGKVLLARQFVEVSRTHIEGLLSAFPKLIGVGQQHTFIETENVRYVYQPLEELFVVLITTKTSNILEDLETLHLISRIVPDYSRGLEEEEIMRNRFELIFAFDEVISLGYRENVMVSQVRTFIEMESHEEKVQEMIARNKEQEAREQQKLRIKAMEQQKKDAKKRGLPTGYSNPPPGSGIGGGSRTAMGASERPSAPQFESYEDRPAPAYSKPAAPAKGMQLGKKKDTRDFMEAMKSEEGLEGLDEVSSPVQAGGKASPQAAAPVSSEGVQILVEEKITVVANRDGGLQNMEVKGDMVLRISDPSKAAIKIVVPPVEDKAVQFKTHPNVDKKLWSEFVIGLKDATRPFPLNQPVGVLKWRLQTKDESAIPLTINCWPSPSGDGSCDVNIEYELTKELELKDVVIAIPIPPSGKAPVVSNVDGDYRFNKSQGVLEWQLSLIDSSSNTGSLEFSCGGEDASQFFPVHVSFTSNASLCGVQVGEVQRLEGGSVTFDSSVTLTTEEYSVV